MTALPFIFFKCSHYARAPVKKPYGAPNFALWHNAHSALCIIALSVLQEKEMPLIKTLSACSALIPVRCRDLCAALLLSMSVLLLPAAPCLADELGLDDSLLQLSRSVGQNSAQTDKAAQPGTAQEQPFSVTFTADSTHRQVQAVFTLQPGAYIYQDSLHFEAGGAQVSLLPLPAATEHTDIQGKHQVYASAFTLTFVISSASAGDTLSLTYQGCDSQGICYPPHTVSLSLQSVQADASDAAAASVPVTPAPASEATEGTQDKISSLLSTDLLLGLLLCFAFGILLDLTPCVLPMLPVFSAMVAGGQNRSTWHNVRQNLSYAAGLCCTYTVLGLLFASLGASLQGILQHPAFILTLAAILLLCALSCLDLIKVNFGLFNQALQKVAGIHTDGTVLSGFILGLVSALIASPCTSAPLAGALLYVLNSGDLLTGSLSFFCIGLGMAFPLFVIGLFGNQVLRKARGYFETVKRILAGLLVLSALYICRTLIAPDLFAWAFTLCCVLCILFAGWSLTAGRKWQDRAIGAVLSLAVAVGAGQLAMSWLQPDSAATQSASLFTPVHSLQELSTLQQEQKGKPVLLDFTAAWCTNCKMMEQTLFASEKFKEMTAGYTLLQADITNVSDTQVKELLQKFQVFGVPHMVILRADGSAVQNTGYMTEQDFAAFMHKAGQAR